MLSSTDFPDINRALDSALSLQGSLLGENLQLRLSRFRLYAHESLPSLQEHGHPFFEWVILLQGHIGYSVDQRRIGELSSGESLLFPPGVQHIRYHSQEDTQIAILQFSLLPVTDHGGKILQKHLDTLVEKHYRLSGCRIGDLVKICSYAQELPPLWRMLVRNRTEYLFLSLFAEEFQECFSATEIDPMPDSAKKWIDRIEKIVEETLDVRLSAEEYSHRIGLSNRQINRIMAARHGITFFRYLQQRRINAAKGLLKTPFQSVKMVAHAVGFSDISLFCRQFRMETGMTPLEYAKREREKSFSSQ